MAAAKAKSTRPCRARKPLCCAVPAGSGAPPGLLEALLLERADIVVDPHQHGLERFGIRPVEIPQRHVLVVECLRDDPLGEAGAGLGELDEDAPRVRARPLAADE